MESNQQRAKAANPGQELKILLKSLEPSLMPGKYCIGSFEESQMMGLAGYLQYMIGIYREKEGITAIFSEEAAPRLELYTESKIFPGFALITLDVISPLQSIGLLAIVSGALAKEGISVNAYSAYYHDHLLVPYEKKDEALAILKKLQKSA